MRKLRKIQLARAAKKIAAGKQAVVSYNGKLYLAKKV